MIEIYTRLGESNSVTVSANIPYMKINPSGKQIRASHRVAFYGVIMK